MPDDRMYLDNGGLTHYHEKVKAELDKKVNIDGSKVLSDQNFTTELKNKLDGLSNYTLPTATATTLGGIKMEASGTNTHGSPALKVDSDGTAYVDWSEAPMASSDKPGLIKLGAGLTLGSDGSAQVNSSDVEAGSVQWANVKNKPDLVTKDEIGKVYRYIATVDSYADLPTGLTDDNIGDVYNVKDTGMNYAWAGTGKENADAKGWDQLGGTFQIATITDQMIDALFT